MAAIGYLQTGQLSCHDVLGQEISCAGSQDAAFKAGMVWPQPRFVADENIVSDKLTSLIWMRDANLAQFPMTWQEALEWVDQINQEQMFGFSDWRLPNRRELRSLVSHQTRRPPLLNNVGYRTEYCSRPI